MQQGIPGIFSPGFAMDQQNTELFDLHKKNLVLSRRCKIRSESEALQLVDLMDHLLDLCSRPPE